jgi:hypothetical protein
VAPGFRGNTRRSARPPTPEGALAQRGENKAEVVSQAIERYQLLNERVSNDGASTEDNNPGT